MQEIKYEAMKSITSRDNQWIKKACSLKQKKGRQQERMVFVEGMRVVRDAAESGIRRAVCFLSPKGREHEKFQDIYDMGRALDWTFFSVTDSVYDKLKDTKAPQGIAAMLPYVTVSLDELNGLAPRQAVVYLQAVQDPGNLGTIIRTAAAANAAAILLSEGSVDVYNDKTIRSAMGAIFKVPIVQDVSEAQLIEFCRQQGRVLLGTAPQGTTSYAQAAYARPVVLAFGNEGNGLSDALIEQCSEVLTIPMRSDTESLNLSMSVGVIVYKAWEANGFKEKYDE
jgi:TrmH family RNA methyltransferase